MVGQFYKASGKHKYRLQKQSAKYRKVLVQLDHPPSDVSAVSAVFDVCFKIAPEDDRKMTPCFLFFF